MFYHYTKMGLQLTSDQGKKKEIICHSDSIKAKNKNRCILYVTLL